MARLRLPVLCALLLVGCLNAPWSHDEVARVPSPSKRLDALLIESNGGATTTFAYRVYIVPHGQRVLPDSAVAHLDAATRSDSAYGAALRWFSDTRLNVEYFEARSARLRTPRVHLGSDTIAVTLAPGVIDSLAPGGGMLYNQRRSPR